jgi:hypothetical protein
MAFGDAVLGRACVSSAGAWLVSWSVGALWCCCEVVRSTGEKGRDSLSRGSIGGSRMQVVE